MATKKKTTQTDAEATETTTAKKKPAKAQSAKAARKTTAKKKKAAPKKSKRTLATAASAADEGDGEATEARSSGGRGKYLVVVESPAKAKTIKKYLGSGYTVKASVGHIKDLPKSKIGVDVEHGFEPEYTVIKGKQKVVTELKAAAKNADRVLLATDPDREGE